MGHTHHSLVRNFSSCCDAVLVHHSCGCAERRLRLLWWCLFVMHKLYEPKRYCIVNNCQWFSVVMAFDWGLHFFLSCGILLLWFAFPPAFILRSATKCCDTSVVQLVTLDVVVCKNSRLVFSRPIPSLRKPVPPLCLLGYLFLLYFSSVLCLLTEHSDLLSSIRYFLAWQRDVLCKICVEIQICAFFFQMRWRNMLPEPYTENCCCSWGRQMLPRIKAWTG